MLLRPFIGHGEAVARVDRRAKQLFAAHGLTETRDQSAILILVSALEHRVEILADRGVDALIDSEAWQEDVDAITGAIHSGRAADGIIEVIRGLAARLSERLPPRPDDRNELRDSVTRVDD